MASKARFTTTTTTTTKSVGMLCVLLTLTLMGITLPAATATMDHGLAAAAAAAAAGRSGANGGGGAGGGRGVKLSQIDGKSLFRSLRASSCSVDCSSAEPEQVCGTDGVTYASRCELQRAKQCDGKRGAQGARVKVRSKGPCPGDTPVMSKCFQEREEARKVARRQSSDVLIPSCNPDGTYSDVQCHTATRYCWCVTKDGRHIPGTSVQERRPRCKGRRRKRKGGRNSKKKKKRKASCTNKERQSFNTDLVAVFREEYDRMLSARGPEAVKDGAGSDDEVSLEKKIVVWKFSQLDTNADDELSFKEIRSFRRMVKKLIKPRRCAKRFHRYCDKDDNRRIQKKEWTLCLWVDIKMSFRIFIALNSDGQTTHSPPDKSRHDPILRPLPPVLRPPSSGLSPQSSRPLASSGFSGRKNRTESSKKNCLEERQAALQHALEEPSANVYVPRCQESGLWRQAQCHEATQYCWCVAEDTGMPLPGIATYRVEPNCSIRDDRQMKGFAFPGCPFEQKRRFIVDLIADMTEEMNQSKVTPQQLLSASELDQLNAREQVARWKLRSMDKDRNDMLERQEWRDLRKTLKKNKNYPRKCRRQFLRYCDENDDKILSMEEWRDCLGLNHNLFNSLPRDPNRFGKTNPFREYLHDEDDDNEQ
ncbi:SPARC-related modular calcium-binding protein 1-like isoform X4 [Babylonia areolata]|uniref:SPARC-related modular calcium-binding protein 1-like isoform X4 n=1 Tax=Babylonia areolata TaxID=304850 RepID=UPI003FD1F1E8